MRIIFVLRCSTCFCSSYLIKTNTVARSVQGLQSRVWALFFQNTPGDNNPLNSLTVRKKTKRDEGQLSTVSSLSWKLNKYSTHKSRVRSALNSTRSTRLLCVFATCCSDFVQKQRQHHECWWFKAQETGGDFSGKTVIREDG